MIGTYRAAVRTHIINQASTCAVSGRPEDSIAQTELGSYFGCNLRQGPHLTLGVLIEPEDERVHPIALDELRQLRDPVLLVADQEALRRARSDGSTEL